MTDKTTNLILKAQVDQSLAAQGVKALRDIQVASDDVQSSFNRIEIGSKSFDVSAESADANAKAIQNLRDQYIEAADAADKLAQSSAEANDASSGGGGINTGNLRTVGRALDQVGLSDIGRPIQQIGDLGIIVKELGAVSDAVAPEIGAVTVGFGGLEVAISPLLLVLAAVALAVVDLKMAFDLMKKGADEAAAAEKARFDQEMADIKQGQDNRAAAKNTSSTQNKDNADTAFQNAQDFTDAIAAKKNQITQNDQSYNSRNVLDFGGRQQDAAVGEQLKKDLNELEDAQNKFFQTSENASKNLAPAIKKIEDQKKAQDDLLKSADDLISKQKEQESLNQLSSTAAAQKLKDLKDEAVVTAQSRDELIKSGDTSDVVTAKIKSYNDSLKQNADYQDMLTKTSMPLIKAREDEAAEIKKSTEALKAQDEAFKSYVDASQKVADATAQVAAMQVDRAKQVKDEEAQDEINAERTSIEKSYAAQIAEAKQNEAVQAEKDKAAQAEVDAEQKLADSKAKIVATEMDSELKAYQNYIDAEKSQTERYNRQRLQTLETAQNDLKNLAASGDVAGFITRSNQAKLDLKHQSENESDAEKQLYDNYQKQVQAARDAETKQLNDLQVSFDAEKKVRDKASQERIAQIENSGQQANTRSAQLEQELNNIREQWRKDDLQRQRDAESESFQERLNAQIAAQNESELSAIAYYNNLLSIQNGSQAATATTSGHSTQVVPQYAGGIDYVPSDRHLAYLDKGERVLTARQNADYSRGKGGGDTYQVTIQNIVGDVATKSLLDKYQQTTVDGVALALQRAKGRGTT